MALTITVMLNGVTLSAGLYMETKYTHSQTFKNNSVAELLNTLKQANPHTIVTNEAGEPLTAYLNPIDMSVSMIVDYDV